MKKISLTVLLLLNVQSFVQAQYSKKSYYDDETTISMQRWFNKEKHVDSLKTYYRSGKINEVFYYKQNRTHGECKQYTEDGRLKNIWIYEKGKLISYEWLIKEYNDRTEEKVLRYYEYLEKNLQKRIATGRNYMSDLLAGASIKSYLNMPLSSIEDAKNAERLLKHYPTKTKEKNKNKIAQNFHVMARYYAQKDLFDKASHYYIKAMNTAPEKTSHKHNFAAYLINNKMYDEGIYFEKKILETHPNQAFSHWSLANAYTQVEEYEKALYHADFAISKETNILKYSGSSIMETHPRVIKAYILHKLGKSIEGIDILGNELVINPKNSYAYRNLGLIEYDLEDYEMACEHLSKAKEYFYESKYRKNDIQEILEAACNAKKITFEKAPSLTMYPNPTKGIVKIQNTDATNFEFEIYNHEQELVKRGTSNGTEIDLSELREDIYILKVLIDEKAHLFRVIKL